MKKKKSKGYTISVVADAYGIHAQTLRLYEREGLLRPSRSEGNTRFYTEEDLRRLELILSLTRDMGVNLAGVEIILNLREKIEEMQREFQRFVELLRQHVSSEVLQNDDKIKNALVRVQPVHSVILSSQKTRQSDCKVQLLESDEE
ncbi:MAG: helix-turn-helix transcriptional regulator [Acidobacteriota bacterium]|nr:helix-turn-helix transcriptional regulator [Blastocatellia bacterium]MDW8411708.1 helix-turn-helix transcriptional regulator [Acidobacteriota bacterium]